MADLKEFEGLINIGRVSKVVKVGEYEISMHTLDSGEYSRMTERLGDETDGVTKRLEALQREVIASAIDSINGKKLSDDEKSKLVGMMQVGLSNILYEEYGKMVEEQNTVLDNAKKNSAQMKTG